MDKSEMRLCRRELINERLQESVLYGDGKTDLWVIKFLVRNKEVNIYGMELKAYG